MRRKFDIELDELNNELIKMGSMCEEAITAAVNSIKSSDTKLVERAKEIESMLDHKEKEIESLCLKLLLQQQPVARDLRSISSALKMITDMERIGDQARDIAEIGSYLDLSEYDNYDDYSKMTKEVIKMVTLSIDAFVRRDVELARAVINNDDVVDELFINLRKEAIEIISTNKLEAEKSLDLVMIAKYLERIGDHATNIAEWVEFSILGEHKEN
ncbi:MAG: phosphate signaling complex protein PhoU [Clostridia bacterium]